MTFTSPFPLTDPVSSPKRMTRYGAIDIGGTKLAVGVTDGEGRVLARVKDWTRVELGPERNCARMAEMLEEARAQADAEHPSPDGDGIPLKAIGIGCGGPLDRQTGVIYMVPNLKGWEGFRLRGYFEDRLGLPTTLDNDANAAGLGEAIFGAGKGYSHVCYFTVSTGIGGGIIANGQLYRGATELAGEFGHQVIEPDGPRCSCGRWGCLESLASGTSIARRAKERLRAGAVSSILDLVDGDIDRVTAESLSIAANQGDRFSLDFWEETGRYLGIGMANIINILNPSVIVVGGGASAAGELLLGPARKTAKERSMIELGEACEVVLAALGSDVGIVGAAALAMEAFG